jgi:alginate O-acetyltransferase complex protein AlgI
VSKTVTEFWRRWHISLSGWFRDYVYIPLGGSRVPRGRLVLNLFVTWMLTGMWHGANWTFLLWGFFYFILLTFEKLLEIPQKAKNHPVFGGLYRIFTILCFVLGWVLFRSDGLREAIDYLKTMFGLRTGQGAVMLTDANSLYLLSQYAIVILVAVFLSTPALRRIADFCDRGAARLSVAGGICCRTGVVAVYLGLFFFALSFMAGSQYDPFIYFNF